MSKRKRDKSERAKDRPLGDHVLVYSTDPLPEQRCGTCRRTIKECVCSQQEFVAPHRIRPVVSIERKGRGGKSVTVVTRLPAHETYLKGLLSYLKRSLGSGGTYYISEGSGVIELQGERDSELVGLIQKYRYK